MNFFNICDLSHENVPCAIRLKGHVRAKLMGDSWLVKSFSRLREGVQISGHTDADADQSGPDFFRFRFNRYRFYRYRLKRNRQRVKLLHRANYRHHQFLTYICQRLSKDCNRQSRYVTDKNYVGQRLCEQKRSVND